MLSRRKFMAAAGLGIGAVAATGVVCGKAEAQPAANLDPAEIIVVDIPDQDRTPVYISLPQNRFGVGFGTSRQALIDRAGKYPISFLKTQPTPWIVLLMSEHTKLQDVLQLYPEAIEVVVPEQQVKFTRHAAITNTASNDEYWQISFTNLAGDLPISLATAGQLFTPSWEV